MSIATDVRAYADLALEQGRSALSQAGSVVTNANKRLAADAPKPVLAALGVADMVAETLSKRAGSVGKRVESLPADAAGNVSRVQETGKALLSRTQDDAAARLTELRDRLDTGVDTVKALPALSIAAASTTTVYLTNAKQAYGKLTARGEARLAELRTDPRVTKVLDELDEVSSAIQARIAPVLGSARSEVLPYLDSAVDAIKDADLGEPASASQPGRRSGNGRRGTTGTRATGRSTSAAPTSLSAKRTAAGRSTTRASASSDAKTGARKAPAAKTTTSARKAPAAKTTTSARKAPAKKA
jgi:hypothetical protein